MNEIWKDIKNFEGLYQVSNFGRVKCLEHKCPGRYKGKYRTVKEHMMTCVENKTNGYLYVVIIQPKFNCLTFYQVVIC